LRGPTDKSFGEDDRRGPKRLNPEATPFVRLPGKASAAREQARKETTSFSREGGEELELKDGEKDTLTKNVNILSSIRLRDRRGDDLRSDPKDAGVSFSDFKL